MKTFVRGILLALCACGAAGVAAKVPDLAQLKLPPGFRIDAFADDVPNARELALGANGVHTHCSRSAGNVYALIDADRNGRAERVVVIASGLEQPTGVAFHDGDLYIGATSRILRLRAIESHLDDPPKPEVVTDSLPSDTTHGWKFIAFGPDGRLYVPIGAPCNTCDRGNGYAKIVSMKPDGSDRQDVAYGIRNTVGFDWHPQTRQLWFTDNGRDMLGDDLPSDELDRVSRRGEHFGYPHCHEGDTLDPEFGKGKSCKDYTPPVLKLGAHVASIGMRFYTGEMFPAKYRNAVIVAQHGSWNRSTKSGYRVMSVQLDGDRVLDYAPLIDGFERNDSVSGRPADVLVMPDGALLVADDLAGAVYRVTYAADAASNSKR